MKTEAKAHESEDKTAREKIDKLNHADSLIFQTEKQLKEFGDKIPADKKSSIETALNQLKEAHKTQDAASIESALKKSKFIPGFVQDKPTAMHYIAVVNYQK